MSSTEFGLSNMIWAAVVIAKDGNYEVTNGKIVGLFAGLLCLHGLLVSARLQSVLRYQGELNELLELSCHTAPCKIHGIVLIHQHRHYNPYVTMAALETVYTNSLCQSS